MNPNVEEKKSKGDVVIDVDDDGDRSRSIGSSHGRKLCRSAKISRICQESSEISPLIKLGCDCKGGIGFIHQNCAAKWFLLKGDNLCEICGKTAENMIKSINNNDSNVDNIILNNVNIHNDDNNNNNNNNNARETRAARIHGYGYLACKILIAVPMFVAMAVLFSLWLQLFD